MEGWTTTHRQERGLFLLKHLLHNVTTMKKKECQMCSHRSQAEEAEEVSPEQPSVRDPPSSQTSLLRGVNLGSQCALLLTAQWLHEGATAGVKQVYG